MNRCVVGQGLETDQGCVEMVELESKVSGATQEDEAVEIDDGVVEFITGATMPQDDHRDEEEGSVCAYKV